MGVFLWKFCANLDVQGNIIMLSGVCVAESVWIKLILVKHLPYLY